VTARFGRAFGGNDDAMRFERDAGADPPGRHAELPDHDEPSARPDRPIAPADPGGHDLVEDLNARVAELDAIAWNLPSRSEELLTTDDA
jgi:hypothetical protein